MAGLWTRPRVARVAAPSASLVSRPYCAAITSYPSACSGPVSLFQHDPSAQIPWQNTMLGLVGVDMASSSAAVATAPVGEPHRHQPGRTDHGDPSHVQVRRHGSKSGALRSALSTGFRQRPRQHGGRQVEATKLLITAATLPGCSSATQCPLSAMTLVDTCQLPASPSPAATSSHAVA